MLHLYSNFRRVQPAEKFLALGAPPPGSVMVRNDGMQALTQGKQQEILGYLRTLFATNATQVAGDAASGASVSRYEAVPCETAEAGGESCSLPALQYFSSAPNAIYAVNVASAGPRFVEVYATNAPPALAPLVTEGADLALIEMRAPVVQKEKKKDSTTASLLGAGAGAGAGLLLSGGNPVGAVAGAGAGAILANWLA